MLITLYCASRTLKGDRLTARSVPDLAAYLTGGRSSKAHLKLFHLSHSTARQLKSLHHLLCAKRLTHTYFPLKNIGPNKIMIHAYHVVLYLTLLRTLPEAVLQRLVSNSFISVTQQHDNLNLYITYSVPKC